MFIVIGMKIVGLKLMLRLLKVGGVMLMRVNGWLLMCMVLLIVVFW